MKPTLILIVTFLLSSQLMFAQESFKLDTKTTTNIDKAQVECIYNYTVNAPLKESRNNEKQKNTYKTILQANNTVSKFWDWNPNKMDSLIYSSTPELSKDSLRKWNWRYYLGVENLFQQVIFKNYPNKMNTVTEEILFDNYIYSENRTLQKWELKDDTLTVCGYICNKAMCNFGGKEWTAWYAPELTLSDGPWKLCGLPGLILKASEKTNTHTFEAIAIRNSDRPIYINKNIKQIKTDRKTVEIKRKEFEALEMKDIFSNFSALNLNGRTTFVLDGKRVSTKRNTVFCTLEE